MLTSLKRTFLAIRQTVIVFEHERGLLYRLGKLEKTLTPGGYRFWFWEKVAVQKVDMRLCSLVVGGQEMLTADRVEVRVSLLVHYAVVDPVLAISKVTMYIDRLYQDVQLALRKAVAARELDALLAGRDEIGEDALAEAAPLAAAYGITRLSVIP